MYDFSKYLPIFDQLTNGLCVFGVMDAMRKDKNIMKPLFVATHSAYFMPTADQMFDGLDAAFSQDCSNQKEKEADIYKFF